MIAGDRRKHSRAFARQLVHLTPSDGWNDSESRIVEMETLSPHGMSISCDRALPDDAEEFTARIPLPDKTTIVETRVEKIWEILDSGDGRISYGMLFADTSSINYKALNRLVEGFLHQDKSKNNRRLHDRRSVGLPVVNNKRQLDRRRSPLPTYTLYIDGRDVDTGHYEYFPYIEKALTDPKKTSEVLLRLKNGELPPETLEYVYARCCIGDDTHNLQAIESAHKAFEIYRNFPLAKRMKIFRDIHDLLLKYKEQLLQLFIAEGHPRQLGEWEFSGMLQAFKAETISFYKSEVSKSRVVTSRERNFLIRKPDGVVCISPPRNAASSNSLTGALSLLGGNTLVVKPPLTLPISTLYLWRNVVDEALRRNGAPLGVLNITVGNTVKLINQWIASPKVNDIVYFGESDRGLEIGNRIYAAGKKPVLELSGKDLLIVWKECDIESAADSLLDGFLGSTQICMVPKTALIHEDIFEQFEKIFVGKVKQLRVGLPSNPNTRLSPVSKISTFFAFLEDAIAKGAVISCGGQRLDYDGNPDGRGAYLEPTVISLHDQLPLNTIRCISEEIFFPLIPIVKITGSPGPFKYRQFTKDQIIYQKIIDMTSANPYGLRISVWCRSITMIRKFVRDVNNSGLLRINCQHVAFSPYLATHGGTGKTGGPFGELNYFWMKTTHLQGISVKT